MADFFLKNLEYSKAKACEKPFILAMVNDCFMTKVSRLLKKVYTFNTNTSSEARMVFAAVGLVSTPEDQNNLLVLMK